MSVALAGDGFVMTPSGALMASDLVAGARVLCIRAGVVTEVLVSEIRILSDQDLVRLLTSLGDVVIPAHEYVVTREGRRRATQIADDHYYGKKCRVEVISPAGLPQMQKRNAISEAILDIPSFLDTFDPPLIQLPIRLAEKRLARTVESVLSRSGSVFQKVEDERWVTFVLKGQGAPTKGKRRFATAEEFLSLTGWDIEKGMPTSRTRLTSTLTRRRLIASLAHHAVPFEARWVPGYLPVECRIRPAENWPSFATITNFVREYGPVFETVLSKPGALIVGLTICGPII